MHLNTDGHRAKGGDFPNEETSRPSGLRSMPLSRRGAVSSEAFASAIALTGFGDWALILPSSRSRWLRKNDTRTMIKFWLH